MAKVKNKGLCKSQRKRRAIESEREGGVDLSKGKENIGIDTLAHRPIWVGQFSYFCFKYVS